MGKLILQVGVSVDWLVARPGRHGAGGWGTPPGHAALKQADSIQNDYSESSTEAAGIDAPYPLVPELGVVGVIVSDIERAVRFYERLGLHLPDNPDAAGHGHAETALPGGLRFTLDTDESIRSFDPRWMPPSGGHRIAIAFRCESPAEVDRLYRDLLNSGATAHTPPWDAFWQQRYA